MRHILTSAMLALAVACSSPEERAAEAMAEYEIAFAGSDYAGAKRAARAALDARDDVADYWIRLARAELALRELGGAYGSFGRALELDRDNVEALQNLAQLSFVGGRYDQSIEHSERLLELDPGNIGAILSLGFVAYEKEQYPEAAKRAEAALALSPLSEDALVLKARAMAKGGDAAAAAATLEQAMRVKGVSAGMLGALLEIYEGAGDESATERTYARILQVAPDNLELKLRNLRVLYATGKPGAALTLIEAHERGSPNDLPFLGDVVDIWLEAPRGAVPVEHVRRLAAPASPAAKVLFSRFLVERGFAADVERLMKPFVGDDVSPDTADATALYAGAQLRLGNAAMARNLADRVLDFDPTHPRALRLRATMAMAARDFDQALVDVQVLVRDQPTEADHRILLANVYKARGQPALAELTYKKAYKDFPASSVIFASYAGFLRQTGRTPAALALAENFTSANGTAADAWKARADLCAAVGDRQCAAASLEAQRRLRQNS